MPTEKICGRSLSSKIPVDMNSIFMKLYVTWSHTSEIWIFEVIFVVFRLMKNIIFNKTESFVGRNISDHACQIVCSKGNCETMYHWFSLLEITMAKIMNNLNAFSAHSYLYPWSWFKGNLSYWADLGTYFFNSKTEKVWHQSRPSLWSQSLCINLKWFA